MKKRDTGTVHRTKMNGSGNLTNPYMVEKNDLALSLKQTNFYPYKYEKTFEPPAFTIKELREAIPSHLFQRSLFKSSLYILANILGVGVLFFVATFIDYLPLSLQYFAWSIYWWFQGAACFGLWVLGHECGHNTLTDYRIFNQILGFTLHTVLLTPYHNWRISHAQHHASTGHMELDQNNLPMKKTQAYQKRGEPSAFMEALETTGIYHIGLMLVFVLVGWPAHLAWLAGGRSYSEGNQSLIWPSSPVFRKKDKLKVMASNLGVLVCIAVLICWGFYSSFWTVFKYYWCPYLLVTAWLVTVTYLQHTDVYLPHYSKNTWNFTRGALTTVDRDYGWFLNQVFHHATDSHVAHHIFSQMPFYNAIKATPYLKEKLGKYYFYDKTPVWKALYRVVKCCNYVEDEGDVLFYRQGHQ